MKLTESIALMDSQYAYNGNGPFDAKMLVEYFSDLTDESTWQNESGDLIAYNGMIVAVWREKGEAASKNGIYFLHDGTTKRTPNIQAENWHRLANLSDISNDLDEDAIKRIINDVTASIVTDISNISTDVNLLKTSVGANTTKLAGIENTVTDYIASVVNSIVTPKASKEVSVAQDGTLGINELSTDKLVQGTKTLVLSGGTASTNI